MLTDVVRAVAPRLPADRARVVATAFADAFRKEGVVDLKAQARLIAQCSHECMGFTKVEENLRYTAARIRQVWPTRPEAAQFAGNPRGLANAVYNGRMGNRRGSDDGWLYRGSGWIHHTGRSEFERVKRRTGFDVVSDPDKLRDPANVGILAAGAVTYIVDRPGALRAAVAGDDIALTRAINGGTIGLDDRLKLTRRALAAIDGRAAPPERTTTERAARARGQAVMAAGASTTSAAASPVAAPAQGDAPHDYAGTIALVGLALVGAFVAWRLWRRYRSTSEIVEADAAQTRHLRAGEKA